MDAMNGHSPDEWLSVSACAKRLGLHERQVRRYAERVKDTDRTPAGQLPLLVRVSAIQAMRDKTVSGQSGVVSEAESTDTGQDTQDSVRTEGSLNAQQIAVIYEGRLQDRERVIQAQDVAMAEKDLRLAVLSEVSEERKQEIERLRDEVEELKQQLAIVVAPTEETSLAVTPNTKLDVPDVSESKPEPAVRPWWKFWER